MAKFIWETSKLKPPYWWQLHLANGLIVVSIQYRQMSGLYHASIGSGLSVREETFATLPEAKFWGINAVKESLREIDKELQTEIPWLLFACLVGAIALHIAWILLLN